MNQFAKRVIVALALCLVVVQTVAIAQNLGAAPQVNVAVQGQTGAQPEGAFLNFVNWIGNVIAPVGAGVAVLGAVGSYATGRGVFRWLVTAAFREARAPQCSSRKGRPVSWGTGPPNPEMGVTNGSPTTGTRRNSISAGAGRSGSSSGACLSGHRVAARGNNFVFGGRRRVLEVDVLGHRDDHPPSGIRVVRFLGRRRAASRRWHWQWMDVRVRE